MLTTGHPAFGFSDSKPGIDQRDYVAVAAMQAILSAGEYRFAPMGNDAEKVADLAYTVANAMIVRSNRK